MGPGLSPGVLRAAPALTHSAQTARYSPRPQAPSRLRPLHLLARPQGTRGACAFQQAFLTPTVRQLLPLPACPCPPDWPGSTHT